MCKNPPEYMQLRAKRGRTCAYESTVWPTLSYQTESIQGWGVGRHHLRQERAPDDSEGSEELFAIHVFELCAGRKS